MHISTSYNSAVEFTEAARKQISQATHKFIDSLQGVRPVAMERGSQVMEIYKEVERSAVQVAAIAQHKDFSTMSESVTDLTKKTRYLLHCASNNFNGGAVEKVNKALKEVSFYVKNEYSKKAE